MHINASTESATTLALPPGAATFRRAGLGSGRPLASWVRRQAAVLALVVSVTVPAAAASSQSPPVSLVKTVADAVLRDAPNPPDFNWGEGVLLSGLMRAHQLTKDDRYLQYVRQFSDHWHARGIGPTLEQKGYCGHWGPGFPLLLLYETTRQSRDLELPRQLIDFMLQRAERTKDGGLSHFSGKPQLWVDTLDMCCPVLAHGSRLLQQPEWQAEAVRQIEVFARHLQDPRTGLFVHMWDETTGQRTTNFWARGNGWVVLACVEVLKNEKPESAARLRVRSLLDKLVAGLLPLQDPQSGLWHTILDAPETYCETSASAMFLYGLAEGRRLRLITPAPEAALRKAWRGLSAQVDAQGRVIGVSGGTTPSGKERYAKVPQGTYTWGTGAFLLAACAYAEGGLAAE